MSNCNTPITFNPNELNAINRWLNSEYAPDVLDDIDDDDDDDDDIEDSDESDNDSFIVSDDHVSYVDDEEELPRVKRTKRT
jgi:hypothetical protein